MPHNKVSPVVDAAECVVFQNPLINILEVEESVSPN